METEFAIESILISLYQQPLNQRLNFISALLEDLGHLTETHPYLRDRIVAVQRVLLRESARIIALHLNQCKNF